MADALEGDKITVSVKNSFLNFTSNEDDEEGESNILRRCSSEGSLSCHSASKTSNNIRKAYTWMPSCIVVSTEHSQETMSLSSWASCTKSQMWWRSSSDRSAGDAVETMSQSGLSQSSFTSCRSSNQFSGSKISSAPRAPWKIWDLADAQVFADASSSSGTDALLSPCSNLVKALHEETGMAAADLQKLENEGILQQLPRNDEGEITSFGSLKHSLGACAPCLFWFRGDCSKKLKCEYCHFRHPGQRAKRQKPNKRGRQLFREMKMARESEKAKAGQSEA